MESERQYDLHSQHPCVPPAKYDTPGQDIRNANELADTTRKIRLKQQYSGTKSFAAPPASQLDAFEFH